MYYIKGEDIMYKNLGLQLYSVRNHMDTEEGVKETFRRLSEIGYTEAQTAGGFVCPVEKFAEYAKDAGIKIIGTHYDMPENVDSIEEYVNMHKILGTTNAGVGGGAYGNTKEQIFAYIEKVNRLAENLSGYGMKFTYHHHSHEFAKIGGARVIDYMVDGFDKKNVTFVLDTYWLQNAGVNINAWIEKLAGRVDILHIKDRAVKPGTNDGFITEIGSGNIDFDSALRVAEETGVKHICVEQDTWPLGFDSIDCVKKSYDYYMNRYCK